MSRTTKRFDQDLYDEFDKSGKKFAIARLKQEGFTARQNPAKMGVDLIVNDGQNDVFYVEVEVKKYIKPGEQFPFKTLNILKRKEKYCQADLPTLFMLFSECGKSYLCVWDKNILKSPLEEVKNKYVYKGEIFYKVNMSLVDDSIDKALERKKNG